MKTYSFDSILVNGRDIKLDQILADTTIPLSSFEASTFLFIQKWFSTSDTFTQKTSGSTGIPKNIIIARRQMITSAQLTMAALDLQAGDVSLLCLDPEYIAGKMMLVRSFVTDMKIVAVNPASNPFTDLSRSTSVDFTAIVPIQLNEIIQSEYAYRLDSTKNILVGGAALEEGIQKKLSKFRVRVYATYGMTETISHVALQPLNGPHPSGYFEVLSGIEINTDDRGCIEIDAPHLPAKVTTNDLVEIKDPTHFKWIGRADNIINTGGIKVIPEKIEGEIRRLFDRHGIENKFLISSVPDAKLGNKIILLVEGDLFDTPIESIKSQLRRILSNFETPKQILTNVKFVFTENGKINRTETTRQIGNLGM